MFKLAFRLSIFAAWEIYAFSLSGWAGVYWGFVLFGIVCFLAYTIMDAWKAAGRMIGRAVSRPVSRSETYNAEINVYPPARPGTPYRGSGDPTAENWARVIESDSYRRRDGN